jgi:hypothetical protein
MGNKGHQKQNQENYEQQLGNTRSRNRDAGESQDRGNQCNDKKRYGPIQHGESSVNLLDGY